MSDFELFDDFGKGAKGECESFFVYLLDIDSILKIHMMKKFFILLALAVLACGCSSATRQEQTSTRPEIRFNDGKLKIVQFTDVHWSNEDSDVRVPQIMNAVLSAEKPDIIVFSGDVVTGGPVVENWTKFVDFMHGIGIPYAVVMGNHDPETHSVADGSVQWSRQATRDTIFTILEKSPLFLGERGPAELQGMGNYVLPVLASDGSDKVGGLLYCMDSYDYADNKDFAGKYGWFSFEQILWYREQSKEYTKSNGGKPVPSFAFFHIPLPEYAEIKTYERTVGNRSEGVYSGELNSGMFSSMYEMGDVMATFVGHDHNNDYIGLYGGIALAYGKATGVDTYGDNVKGGRVIMMYEGQKYFDTWLRDEFGNKTDLFYYPSGASDEEIAKYKEHPAHDVSPEQKGVSYTYYEGPFESVGKFETEGKVVEKGVMQTFDISGAKSQNHFGYEFDCWFYAPESDLYDFHLSSDDGAVITIDGEIVVDLDGSHSIRHESGSIRLEKGYHDFELRYFDDSDGQELSVAVMSRRMTGFEDAIYVK